MGPHSLNDGSTNNDNNPFDGESDDNEDGWRIGFDVQMRGVGMENFDAADNDETDVAAVDDDEDDEYDGSFYSDNDGNDVENADTLRAGYRPLQSNVGCRDEFTVMRPNASSEAGPRRRPIDEQHLELLPPPKDDQRTFAIPHQPNSIELSPDAIEKIKAAMSQILIAPPPQWASAFKDEALSDMVRKLRNAQ